MPVQRRQGQELTDDERRIPVQMKSKVRIGSITATLVGGSYWPEKK